MRGKATKLKGLSLAYFVVDEVFERSFFTLVSWTGEAKKNNQPKYAFVSFTRLMGWFHALVHSMDNDWTMEQNVDFFKNRIIRNAGKRMISKGVRRPHSKTMKPRPKTNIDEYVDDKIPAVTAVDGAKTSEHRNDGDDQEVHADAVEDRTKYQPPNDDASDVAYEAEAVSI